MPHFFYIGEGLSQRQLDVLKQAFATGNEKDYHIRVNFVGYTGAGKTSLMWQMFFIKFNPFEMESTDGIDVSNGYCTVNISTGEWKRHDKKQKGLLDLFNLYLHIIIKYW